MLPVALELRDGDARPPRVARRDEHASGTSARRPNASRQMSIKVSSPFQPVSALSGGTQQKVVIGKFMEAKPEVVLFVDATRGIDVADEVRVLRDAAEARRRRARPASSTRPTQRARRTLRPCRCLPRRRARTDARGRRHHPGRSGRGILRRRAGRPDEPPGSRLAVGPCRAGSRGSVLTPRRRRRSCLFVIYLVRNGGFGAIEALGISNAALPLALVAAGETFVILTNGIDLSIGQHPHALERHVRGRCRPTVTAALGVFARRRRRRSRRACERRSSSRI